VIDNDLEHLAGEIFVTFLSTRLGIHRRYTYSGGARTVRAGSREKAIIKDVTTNMLQRSI
jgi:uncharacterized protein (DUF2164 family)